MTLSETAQRRLLWVGVVAVILSLRVGCVLYDRSRPFTQKSVVERPIDGDRLVVVPKFYVEDFASAKQLIGKTIWVKQGYTTAYFANTPRLKPSDRVLKYFDPLESLTIEDITEQPASEAGSKETLLGFHKKGEAWLTVVGVFDPRVQRYEMYLDELFYAKNPRELYSRWDKDTWEKIEKHSLEVGMTQAQAALAMGLGRLVTMEAGGVQLYEFPRKPGGEPGKTRVRFLDGRVKELKVLQ